MNSFQVGCKTKPSFFEVCRSRLTRSGWFCGLLVFIRVTEASALSQAAFLDFNSAGQYTANFNPWNDSGGVNAGNYCFAERTSAGVASSGGVSVFQNTDTSATYNGGAWNFSTNGAVAVVSVLIKANGLTSANKVQLGFLNTSVNGFYNNANVAFESFRFVPVSSTAWSMREQYKAASGIPTETILGTNNIIAGHWYKFWVGLTNTGGVLGNYTAGCAIYDFGADGISPGPNVITFSP